MENIIEVFIGKDGTGETRIQGEAPEVLEAVVNGLGHIMGHSDTPPPTLEGLLGMSVQETCGGSFMLEVSEDKTGFGGHEDCLYSAISDVMKGCAESLELSDEEAQELYSAIYNRAMIMTNDSADQEPQEKTLDELPQRYREKLGMG